MWVLNEDREQSGRFSMRWEDQALRRVPFAEHKNETQGGQSFAGNFRHTGFVVRLVKSA